MKHTKHNLFFRTQRGTQPFSKRAAAEGQKCREYPIHLDHEHSTNPEVGFPQCSRHNSRSERPLLVNCLVRAWEAIVHNRSRSFTIKIFRSERPFGPGPLGIGSRLQTLGSRALGFGLTITNAKTRSFFARLGIDKTLQLTLMTTVQHKKLFFFSFRPLICTVLPHV